LLSGAKGSAGSTERVAGSSERSNVELLGHVQVGVASPGFDGKVRSTLPPRSCIWAKRRPVLCNTIVVGDVRAHVAWRRTTKRDAIPLQVHASRRRCADRAAFSASDCANCGPPGMQGLRCLRASDCANCSPPGRQGLPSRAKRVGGATPHLFATRRDLLADFTASSACSRPWASMECLKSQIVSGCAVTRALFALHPPRLGKHHATNGGSYLSPIAVN